MPTVTVTAAGETATTTYGGFAFGAEVGANDVRHPGGDPAAIQWSYNTVRTALGRDLGSRLKFFDGGQGITKAVTMWQATGAVEPHPVFAIQTYTASALNTWMNGLTAQCGLIFKQEFTGDIYKGQYTVAQFNSWYADLRSIIDGHPNGHFVDLQMAGMEYTERVKGAIHNQVVVPERCAIGNDTYIQNSALLDPVKLFANGLDWWNNVKGTPGVTWRTSESGISRTDFTPTQRTQWLQDVHDFAVANGMASINYWATDNTGSTADWSIDKPGDEAVAAKLASLIGV